MLAAIRQYFAGQGVLEVETPLLCSSTATDPHLQSFAVPCADGVRYLQTSPEFPMKRLLAAGSDSIYQICKAFRVDEVGARHNPEFSLLEWYRVGWSLAELQREVVRLIQLVGELFGQSWSLLAIKSYRELFVETLRVDPFVASVDELAEVAARHVAGELPELDRLGYLDLLMSRVIEPGMPDGLLVVADFPAEQAALSVRGRDAEGNLVARRFEVYLDGVELANGYQELVDAGEQRQRFMADNRERVALGLGELPLPEGLLGAMEVGLPECSGVALGLDRLLMLGVGGRCLQDVLSFGFDRA